MSELELDLFLLEISYPDLFYSIKNLYDYDRKVELYIKNKYGDNTIENIIKFNEYNNEIEKVSKGNITNIGFSKAAQKHSEYFQKFLFESNKLAYILGYQNADKIIKQIQRGLRAPTTQIDTSFMDTFLQKK
jgi:hypothetical protein